MGSTAGGRCERSAGINTSEVFIPAGPRALYSVSSILNVIFTVKILSLMANRSQFDSVKICDNNYSKPSSNAGLSNADSIIRETVKCEQLFAERGQFHHTRSARHDVAAYEKYHCCLKI
jgi:hypothetical protein